MPDDRRPLVVHVVYSFATGGLENGVVNLINRMPAEDWRHAVLALDRVERSFAARVVRDDVEFIELRKGPGHLYTDFPKLGRLFRRLRPSIVHTRNLAALEAVVPAWLAGVPVRIHGEHGRDVHDPDGTNRRRQWIRRLYRPFVHHYVALSFDLERYLHERIGVEPKRVRHIFNGVDVTRFQPAALGREAIGGSPFNGAGLFVFGTVGRLDPVKDQLNLVRAFAELLRARPAISTRLRLIVVGEGPERGAIETAIAGEGLGGHVWLAGERDDIPAVLRGVDCFVLPSLAEGISNTILEAMASGLPVIATRVGANADLVQEGWNGAIVPRSDTHALAMAMAVYALSAERVQRHGAAGRSIAETRFSLERMVADYSGLYGELLRQRAPLGAQPAGAVPDQSPLGVQRH